MNHEHQLSRYAEPTLVRTWSTSYLVTLERQIWHAVCSFHMTHGVIADDQSVLQRLRDTMYDVDLDSIERRERRLRHDLMARLEETIAVADIPQVLHLGMTSADVVENSYLIRMAETCELLRNQPGFAHLGEWPSWLRLRGIKGPVGTQQDQLDLFRDETLCHQLDNSLARHFGFDLVAGSVGQVMWRSTDLAWAVQLLSGIKDEPWRTLAQGYLQMVAGYAGDTWNEGDVASSSVRRIALPSLALVASAQTQTRKKD